MTVTYSLCVAKAKLCGFAKLLLRWRGSIYKLLYREMIIFCGLYYSLSLMYRYVLAESHRIVFEKLALYCEAFTKLIPLSFVLGFYVSIVVGRWWNQYKAIPWPDKLMMLVAAHLHGEDERGRIMRRTLARYLLLMQSLTFQAISTSVRKRFPTEDHLVEAGIMTKEEQIVYEQIPGTHGKWWTPASWFTSLVVRARKEGRIKEDILLIQILNELHEFRGGCGLLFAYDWISIPLVYTQTVTIATYSYFLATIMGRQYLDPGQGYSGHDIDLYIPIFTLLEFFFFMGWLKVAEQLINPFGEDDDDFELNWMLDRNLLLSIWIVDEMYNKHPKLIKDAYWDESEPTLPYTKSSVMLKTQPHLGSAMRLDIDPEDSEFVPMDTIIEEDNEDHKYRSPPQSPTNENVLPNFITNPVDIPGNRKEDTSSQLGLKVSADFPGSRIINMILGHSSENIPSSSNKSQEKGIFAAPFILKPPKKKNKLLKPSASFAQISRRSTDEPETQFLSQSVEPGAINSYSYSNRPSPAISRRGTPDERRSLFVESDFNDYKDSQNFLPYRGRGRASIDLDTIKNLRYNVTPADGKINSSASSRSNSRQGTTDLALSIEESKSLDGDMVSTMDDFDIKEDEFFKPVNSDQTDLIESAFEPNSSQESLSPYASNQSTVTSLTELLKKTGKTKD